MLTAQPRLGPWLAIKCCGGRFSVFDWHRTQLDRGKPCEWRYGNLESWGIQDHHALFGGFNP